MSTSTHRKPSIQRHTKQKTGAAVNSLDARIQRLSEAVLPKQPYLLSVPSDVPYRHNSRFIQTWYVSTPFDKREEQLQYLSFLPHNDDYEDLLKVEGGWADDNGDFAQEKQAATPLVQSIPGTPNDKTNRKKISLKDYKKDKSLIESNGTPSRPALEKSQNKPASLLAPPEKMPARSPDPSPRSQPKHERGRSPVRADERRAPISTNDGPESPLARRESESPRPAKKRKLSHSPSAALPPKTTEEQAKRMPKLLSPTLPASPQRKNDLPELLSPLLPPTLMKALATPPSTSGSDSAHQHQRHDSVRSILGTINEDGPRSTDKLGASSGNRVRSDSQHSARSATSASGRALTKAGFKPGATTPTTSRSPGPRQRHIIVLKYGKKNRKRVEGLLKFKPRPKQLPKVPDRPPSTHRETSTPLRDETKLNLQRDRTTEVSAAKVKPATSDPIKRPSTPLTNGIRDAKNPARPASKTIQATPKKELKSSAMRRIESVEAADPSTPGEKMRSSTPASVERNRLPKNSPLPTSAPGTTEDDRQVWQKLDKDREYFAFSRKIKHEATELANKATNTAEMHKPVLLMIEALLGFMLNLSVQGHIKPRVDPGWPTILGYYNFVFQKTRHFPHLHGLVIQLGAVCRQAIQKAHMERLARDPLPDELHSNAAPTPGSDGTTKNSDDIEASKKRYLAHRDELLQNADELQSSWLKGSRLLGIDMLIREYPETWRGRLKDNEHRGVEKVSPSGTSLAKGYYLPVDPATTPFEAAEYAMKVMGEWADREDVDWRCRLRL